jgi:CDGSH-type Zn-finger protein
MQRAFAQPVFVSFFFPWAWKPPLAPALISFLSQMSHSELLVGAAFASAFGVAAWLISRTGPARKSASSASSSAAATAASALCGPLINATFDGPVGIPLPEDGSSKWICRCGQSKKFPWVGGTDCGVLWVALTRFLAALRFCDGTHNAYNKEHGTKFVPFEANRANMGEDTIWVCQCG